MPNTLLTKRAILILLSWTCILTTLSSQPNDSACEVGGTYFNHTKLCYKQMGYGSYDEALTVCKSLPMGDLICILDGKTVDFIQHHPFYTCDQTVYSPPIFIWIGMDENGNCINLSSNESRQEWSYLQDNQQFDKSSSKPTQISSTMYAQSYCTAMKLKDTNFYPQDCTSQLPYYCSYAPNTTRCPDGFYYFEQTNACYMLVHDDPANFNNASTACTDRGVQLASIHSSEENNFIALLSLTTYSLNEFLWIGLVGTSSTIGWLDGTTYDFDNLLNNDTKTVFCASMWTSSKANVLGFWRIDNCSTEYSNYICKQTL